ncbi:tetratricopeptide repeat protein [Janthinobacterium fluminis]|uniref:Tetratricopeptide repeat protein n=1 Tax=Janthinobacterium fluminis TaxID=2987524 RepID=A0ABT5JWU1_9BURK|nr:tetratricopeptide repeat protein [Janthinobacterium fluminis]MDC8756885.1 tetratricopeptide repeat protein [Janthinobacterium fluminis]
MSNSILKGAGALLALAALCACDAAAPPLPTSALIEADAMHASHNQDAAAERRVHNWAMRGMPVAERELALLYQARPASRGAAMALFERAARAGDVQAAFELGEMYRDGPAGQVSRASQAWAWYVRAAAGRHPKAALMLGLMAKNGEGVARDPALAASWLALASERGNPHAMFLLYNAYQHGLGLPRDVAKGRHWLEEAAEHEYPPAIQELAMTVQHGDAITPKDELRAGHLLKEATEHRHNNWNRF